MTAPAPSTAGPLCPRCGAPHSPNQEYCLECGYRLAPTSGAFGRLATAWRERLGWYPGDWIWPVLLGFVIAVAGAAAAIVLSDAGAQNKTLVATEGGPAHAPTSPPPPTTVVLPSVPSGTPTGTAQTRTTAPPTRTTPRAGALISWPAGQTGYTVILESIPTSAGRSLAVERARAASHAGLPQVGVLDSSRYSSLHPGYYVVFSGVYSSAGQAARARATASAKGFGAAYTKQVTR